jgi:hypothetical protein
MTMYSNGTGEAVLEDESHFSNPEWESPYSNPEQHETEWETHFSNPETHEAHYANPYSPEAATEDEHEGILGNILGAIGLESEDYSSPEAHEAEWETHEDEWETHYSNPEAHETEWETQYSNPEVHERADEADRFLPFLAPLAMKALPLLGKAVMPMAKKLLPQAARAVSNVLRGVLGRRRRRPMPVRPGGGWAPRPRPVQPGGWAPRPVAPSDGWQPSPVRPGGLRRPGPAWRPGRGPRRRVGVAPIPRSTVAGLFRQLSRIFGEGESEAAHLETQLFGANEMEGELASHEAAHEAALTEVLAAEATHTETESEAEALLGTALPITIRIMGGGRSLRRVTPSLVQANARLVQSIRSSGPAGPQLLRVVPAIQRRTVASLRAAQRAGRPLTPGLVSQVMAGQAARVLATPRLCGPALVRNAAIRQATVGRPGQMIRPRRPLPR